MSTATIDQPIDETKASTSGAGPIATARHFGLSAKLWQKMSNEKKPFCSLEIEKSYKDGDEFKEYRVSFLLSEWPLIRELGDQMYREGIDHQYQQAKEARE